jgi:hypothetical protein
MSMHPYIGSQLAGDRQREMLAQADQQRLVRQLRKDVRTSRRAGQAGGRMIRLFRRPRPAALSS